MVQFSGQLVVILFEGIQRYVGRDVQRFNIFVVRIIVEIVRIIFGLKGMDKMFVDSFGDIVVMNDGVMIFDKIDFQYLVVKMMVEVVKIQDKEVGDGIIIVVVIVGEFFRKVEEFFDQNIYLSIIIKGYVFVVEKV